MLLGGVKSQKIILIFKMEEAETGLQYDRKFVLQPCF